MRQTGFYSFNLGKLARGCQLCVKGQKSVFFVTGICSKQCYYCPISDQKKNQDVTWINEWPTKDPKDWIKEIKLCKSKGAGITGGDPLTKLDRTCQFIKLAKKNFQTKKNKFHIHLYTPLNLVTENTLRKLYNAGLDEIRFHPDLDDEKLWPKLLLAKSKKFKWDVGVEIPAIPENEKMIFKLVNYLSENNVVDFLNINELEISDTNANQLLDKNYVPKDNISYGVKGSEKLAKKILSYIEKTKNNKIKNVHYCTCKLKDKVQLKNRIKHRANSIKTKFDYVTDDGTLMRGIIMYNEKTYNPIELVRVLTKESASNFILDEKKSRIITSPDILEKYSNVLKKNKLRPAIVEEYPTYDRMLVDLTFL